MGSSHGADDTTKGLKIVEGRAVMSVESTLSSAGHPGQGVARKGKNQPKALLEQQYPSHGPRLSSSQSLQMQRQVLSAYLSSSAHRKLTCACRRM